MNPAAKCPPRVPTDDRMATSDPRWHPTTAYEMRAFVATGFSERPEYRDYWSEDLILHDRFVSGVMTRHRYEKLSQYFHCSLPGEEDTRDKLAKVRPLLTLCEESFHRCCAPSRHLSIDEAMIRFDGTLRSR